MIKNTNHSYGTFNRYLHWSMAFIIITMLIVGYYMKYVLPPEDLKWQVYGLHKATGVIILSLAVLRLIWKLINPVPQLPKEMKTWQKYLATYNIRFLYILMFSMPITGLLMSLYGDHPVNVYGLFVIQPLPKNEAYSQFFDQAHMILAIIFIGTILLHFSGAMFHHFIRQDNILRRMWCGK